MSLLIYKRSPRQIVIRKCYILYKILYLIYSKIITAKIPAEYSIRSAKVQTLHLSSPNESTVWLIYIPTIIKACKMLICPCSFIRVPPDDSPESLPYRMKGKSGFGMQFLPDVKCTVHIADTNKTLYDEQQVEAAVLPPGNLCGHLSLRNPYFCKPDKLKVFHFRMD